jgi:hypothetical protein
MGLEVGACRRTCAEVSSSHVVKYPASVAAHHVEIGGLKQAACKNATLAATVDLAKELCAGFLAEIFLAETGQRELCAGMMMNKGGYTAGFLTEISLLELHRWEVVAVTIVQGDLLMHVDGPLAIRAFVRENDVPCKFDGDSGGRRNSCATTVDCPIDKRDAACS